MRGKLLLSFGLVFAVSPLLAIDPILVPVGPERQPFAGSPCCHDLAGADFTVDGEFITIWNSDVGGVSSSRVLRFDQNGLPVGDAIEIPREWSLRSTGRISGGIGGHFVVLSRSESLPSILRATRYSAAGQLGSPIDLAQTSTAHASVDHDDLGRFVVLWPEGPNLRAARFEADGSRIGEVIEVSQAVVGFDSVEVSVGPDRGFWAFYQKIDIMKADGRLHRRLFNADGVALGPEIEVVDPGQGHSDSRATVGPNGTAASVSRFTHGSRGQLFDAQGGLGPLFEVWDDPADVTYVPLVAPLANGEFVASAIVYVNNGKSSAYVTRIAPDGQAMGPHLVFEEPFVDVFLSMLVAKGSRVILSLFREGSHLESFQIYEAPLFADSFESGDLSAWAP